MHIPENDLMVQIFTYGILSVIWIHLGAIVWSNYKNLNKMEQQHHVPDELQGTSYHPEAFGLARLYAYQTLTFRNKKTIVEGVILTCVILTNGIGVLWDYSERTVALIKPYLPLKKSTSWPWLGIFFFTLCYTILERVILYLPELEEFEIEKYFGFSRASRKKLTKSFIKVSILKVILWPVYLTAFSWGLQKLSKLIEDKSWTVLSLMGFSYWLLFPTLIVVVILANSKQVQPLPEGGLKTRIDSLADKVNFPKDCIFVLHSTKAKNHPNAFHLKFLNFQRLIIFESLIEFKDTSNPETLHIQGKGLSDPQVEAVIAHELGHYHLSHGFWGVTYLQLKTLLSYLLTMWLIQYSVFYNVIGISTYGNNSYLIPGLIAADLFVVQYTSKFLDFLFAIFQRYTETQADKYAVRLGYGHTLESALVKLTMDNYIFPVDDAFYTVINCTHPSMITRMRNIRKCMISN